MLTLNQSQTHTLLRQQLALFQVFPFNMRITVIGESGFTFYSSMPHYTS